MYLLIGTVIGFMSGLLGIGGGMVLVPIMFYVFGMQGPEAGFPPDHLMHMALATAMATIPFTTASSVVQAINSKFGNDIATALDGVSIVIRAPMDISQRVAFMGMIENLDVQPGEPPARVVINARTGTVVISRNVRVTAAAVTHGGITVKIAATNEVSQPNALAPAGAATTAVTNADVAVTEARNPMFLFKPGVDLRDIVDAVNQVGATPSALVSILEALKRSGSLRAELLVI